jgi:cyclohexadienyl dehydratase
VNLSGLCATLLAALWLSGCAAKPPLRVGSSGDYPPFSIAGPAGVPRGFDVDVAQSFADDTGHRLDLVRFRWPALLDDLDRDRFDVAMSGVTIRADRALSVRFSRPYAVTGAVVVRRADAPQLASLDDVDRPEVRLAVNRGGHLERVTRARFRHAQIVPLDDNTLLHDVLLDGSVDAVVSESFEARSWAPDGIVVLEPFTRDRKAYAVRPGEEELLVRLDDWLAAREADGWMTAQRRHWLGGAAALGPQQLCREAIAAALDVRLQLMPAVAAAKREAGMAIEDAGQEERVIAASRAAAEAEGLDAAAAERLFRSLIEAAKKIQAAGTPAEVPPASLAELRGAIAAASGQLLREARRCRGRLGDGPALARALETGVALREPAALDPTTLAARILALTSPTSPTSQTSPTSP